MSSVGYFIVDEESLAKRQERHLLSVKDVEWAFGGSVSLVLDLRKAGELRGKRYGRSLFFCSKHVASVAERWLAGELDVLLGVGSDE